MFSNARPNQKGTKSNGVCFSVVHRKKPAEDSLEFKKARSYCFDHSRYDVSLQERVFIGRPEDVVAAVNISIGVQTVPEEIPDTPQGLVLADNRCTGAFQ